jgi:hypothetical protein
MCLEYLVAFYPIGIALLIILQAKALTLGISCLFSQTLLRTIIDVLSGGVGFEDPASKRSCKHSL